MELTVTTKRDNALLDRTEVYFTIAHPGTGTPSRSDIKKALAGTLNAKGVVILDWARSDFGSTSTRGYAKVYPSKERALKLETPPILIRNGLLAAAKKEAPPAEGAPAPAKKEAKPEAKAEAPKAEKKEESKAPPKEEKKEAPKSPAKDEKKEAAKPAAKEEKKAEAPKEKKPAGKKEGK